MTKREKIERVYSVLVECARNRQLISYSSLSERVGFGIARTMRFQLEPIYDICTARGLPGLTSLAVRKDTTRQGVGYVPVVGSVKQDQESAYAFDWSAVSIP